MQKKLLILSLFLAVVIVGCNLPLPAAEPTAIPPTPTQASSPPGTAQPLDTPAPPTPTTAPTPTEVVLPSLSIVLGSANQENGIRLDHGGDVDTALATKGEAGTEVRQTGNGEALPALDGNTTQDYYIQFNVEDDQLSSGEPSGRVRVEVDYFDEGNDTFMLEYDGRAWMFSGGGSVAKTNSLTIKTAAFNLCDAYFNNRANGADFRLSDNGDGAEWIAAVRVIALPDAGPQTLHVDDFGANPFDDQPDSEAIQAALDSTCSQDTVVFTSGVDTPDYKGYGIDQTLFLTGMSIKQDLTFTASDPANHALLKATADLQGFVAHLYARSRISSPGAIDRIDFGFIDIHGGRDLRVCHGADGIANGVDDNWGSWLPECSIPDDPWCLPGILSMDGGANWDDITQDYAAHPEEWSTDIVVHDLVLQQGECGTALGFSLADSRIEHVTIDTAGDHVHGVGCAFTDADGDIGAWSDGITMAGPGLTVSNNTVINPSDIGIVFFGGKDSAITHNIIRVTEGNYGAFGGIAIHPWSFGDISGLQISGNTVTSQGDENCGGLHAGINLGTHMWSGGCVHSTGLASYGNRDACLAEPNMEEVEVCTGGLCQLWAYLPAGATLTMRDNTVQGAHINYLIEGLALFGEFVDQNNISLTPRRSDWQAAKEGCQGVTWGPLDKVAHHPSLPGYTDLIVHCEW